MARLVRQLTLALIALFCAAGIAVAVGAAELEPQHATVVTPGAAVRSGPADSFYLTETLPQDTAVEVYRQQPDGWCAIRPPAESFSWVYAPHVRLKNEELAEINKDDVATRVGSRLSTQRDVVQVRLQKGEVVQIVGKDERNGDTWYKIAPPAGEFRWIHVRDLAIDGKPRFEASEENPVSADDGVQPASHEVPADNSAAGQWTAIAAPPLATSTPMTPIATNNPAPATGITPISPAPAGPVSSAELSQQLSELELRLSRMVAEPMATWSIESMEQSAEQLLSRADTVADRDAVKSTLAKIDRFASIQRRSTSMNPATVTVAPPGMTPVVQGQTVTPLPATGGTTASPYDAVGILRPVVSRRPGAPQFALVDDQGQVVTFVTPSPDVNLQPYLGRRIGIAGSRGYIPEFRRPHVTAGRITPLNERMLR